MLHVQEILQCLINQIDGWLHDTTAVKHGVILHVCFVISYHVIYI